MKFKRFDKKYWPMFWLGLIIWLGSILLLQILDWTGNTPDGQEVVMELGKMMFQESPFGLLFLFCVLQPALEEVCFRLWGVGKKWMTIICMLGMAFFCVSEIGLWGLLFVGAFLVVWLVVKNTFCRNWLLTLISSAAFALCHISGFGDFSLGMVLGLTDIFGMAIVMCWLTLNLSFGFSVLLHILNNSIAILLPLLFLSDPVHSTVDNDIKIDLEALKPFADNTELIENSMLYSLSALDSTTTEFYMVGEPAEIYKMLLSAAFSEKDVYLDWKSQGVSMEERVVYHVKYPSPQKPDFDLLSQCFYDDVALHLKHNLTLICDTVEDDLMNIVLVYPNGNEFNLNDVHDFDYSSAYSRVVDEYGGMGGNIIVSETDSTGTVKQYCLLNPSPLDNQFASLRKTLDMSYGYSIKYIPERKVKRVIVKVVKMNSEQ